MIKRILFVLSCWLITAVCFAQSKGEQQVGAAVEKLHAAMINADSTALSKLVSSKLAYVHSGGVVDDKAKFIEKIVSGKSDFITISVAEQFITVSKKTAIVRHILDAITNDGGKSGTVHLGIMQVWQK